MEWVQKEGEGGGLGGRLITKDLYAYMRKPWTQTIRVLKAWDRVRGWTGVGQWGTYILSTIKIIKKKHTTKTPKYAIFLKSGDKQAPTLFFRTVDIDYFVVNE